MNKSISLLVGLLALGVGCAPVSSASLRLANGGDAHVSVLPTDSGTHNVSVTSPESGQIDWSSVEAIEPERPGSRVAAHVLLGIGLAGMLIGVASFAADATPDLEDVFGSGLIFVGGGVVAVTSVPFYIASGIAMGETLSQVEAARAYHVQAAASAPAPTVVVEQPAAPMIGGVNEGDEPSAARPGGVEGP